MKTKLDSKVRKVRGKRKKKVSAKVRMERLEKRNAILGERSKRLEAEHARRDSMSKLPMIERVEKRRLQA